MSKTNPGSGQYNKNKSTFNVCFDIFVDDEPVSSLRR
jgi:hypothetical protein